AAVARSTSRQNHGASAHGFPSARDNGPGSRKWPVARPSDAPRPRLRSHMLFPAPLSARRGRTVVSVRRQADLLSFLGFVVARLAALLPTGGGRVGLGRDELSSGVSDMACCESLYCYCFL